MSVNSLSTMKAPDYSLPMIGRVVANNDPTQRQRVKIRVPNVLDFPEDELPWVMPLVQSGFGITNSAVTVAVPVVGSIAVVSFQNGELYYGILQGYVHYQSAAIPGELAGNYPNRRGFKDPGGNVFYIDISNNEVRFSTPTVTIMLRPNGDVQVTTSARIEMTAPGGMEITANTTINGDVQVNGKVDTTGDVKAGNISLQTHRTSGVTPGMGVSNVPIP